MSLATTGFQATLERIAGVEGWLTDAQSERLWNAARRLGPGERIVEIGSFRGRSTIVLANAASEGVELVAIDPHGGGDRGPQEITAEAERGARDYVSFHDNLRDAGVEERVRHVRAFSDDALGEVAGEVSLLFIDGAHRYGPARADIERWGARVAPGGTMLIHDAFNAIGVTLAQLRLLVLSRRWRYRGRSGSLAEYELGELTGTRLALNAVRQLAGLPYFARNMLIKVALVLRARRLAELLGSRDGSWPY
jgi:predicted O-methyltransferase YrrM